MTNAEAVIFTDSAAKKVHELISEEENPNLNLRVYIEGGGCSGYKYGFTFDEDINPDDTIIKKMINNNGNQGDDDDGDGGSGTVVKLLIDPGSFQYLVGAEIDYRETPGGGEFVIRNPNAKTTCGCGSSFSA
jgi:iron-sulfur cluster insertion protein